MTLIQTTVGELDESLLEKREGISTDGAWVEYYLNDTLVHRSATVGLRGLEASIALGKVNEPSKLDEFFARYFLGVNR